MCRFYKIDYGTEFSIILLVIEFDYGTVFTAILLEQRWILFLLEKKRILFLLEKKRHLRIFYFFFLSFFKKDSEDGHRSKIQERRPLCLYR